MSSNPLEVLRQGVRAVPAVKFAVGVAGVMAALAVGKAFFSTPQAALLGAVAMLALMVLLLLFAAAARLAGGALRTPALVMTWTILALFVGSASLAASSVFFAWPEPFSDLLRQWFRLPVERSPQIKGPEDSTPSGTRSSPSPPATGSRGQIVISEFRTRGPQGANDEFIELQNVSSSAVSLRDWRVEGSNGLGGTQTRRILGPLTLNPGCYFLLTNSHPNGGPYSGAATGDMTYGVGMMDDGGIALQDSSGRMIDLVGMSIGSAFGEGTRLASFGNAKTDRSYARTGSDTNDNARDFTMRSPSDPQNTSSACSSPPSTTGAVQRD